MATKQKGSTRTTEIIIIVNNIINSMGRSDRDNFIISFLVVWILAAIVSFYVFGTSFLIAVIIGIIGSLIIALIVHHPYLLWLFQR